MGTVLRRHRSRCPVHAEKVAQSEGRTVGKALSVAVALQRAENAGTRSPAEIQRVLAPLKEAGSWKPLLQSLKGHADLIYSVVKAILSARLPGLDHACFTIAISACASQWEWACDLFTSMTRAALEPNSISYNALITCCEKGRQWHRALVLLGAMGDNADVFSFSAAISACEKCGHWQIALQLFENMATARVTADEIGFNAAISACEKGGQWPSAAQLLQRMAIRRCLASVVSFSAAISACAAEWLAALCMLESMELTQVKSNEVTFNALLNCCEKSWQHGLSIADMRQLQLLPDVVTLSTSLSTRFGQWPRALSRFRSFSATSLNLVTFNAMIHACESSWPLALELFTELGSPDVVSFGSVAAALCRGAKLKEAVQLMKQMTAADLRIDLVSFNASMTSCQAVGRWQEAFFLVDFMLQIEISPDVTSLCCIVTSAAQASWRLALGIFKETMNRVGFCAAINACEKGQRWPEAIHLLQMLRLRQADVPSFNAALSCLEGGQWRQALQLFQDMVKADLHPNDISFNSLISACEDRWFLALHFLEVIAWQGGADVISFSAVLRSLEKAGRWRDALRVLDGMKGATVQPNAVTFEATVLACERAWQPFHALRLLDLMSQQVF